MNRKDLDDLFSRIAALEVAARQLADQATQLRYAAHQLIHTEIVSGAS